MTGIDVAYRTDGSGPPVYMIHGIGSRKEHWNPFVAALSNRYTCVTYDLRGHGESPIPPTPYSLEQLVEDLEMLRKHHGHEQIHVIGHSLGGVIGPAYARAYADRVLSVGLISTAARRKTDWTAKGEIMLGLKIEDKYCLPDADNIAAVPGLSFYEWGPGDMGMSHGDPDSHDPPYNDEMNRAKDIVKSAGDKSGLTFLSSWNDSSMTDEEQAKYLINEENARILHVSDSEIANQIREEMGRKMPW